VLVSRSLTRSLVGFPDAAKPQSFKISREKERKEKQLKQAVAVDPLDAPDVHAEPDAVKSRNHRMVIAPSRRDPRWSERAHAASDSVADRSVCWLLVALSLHPLSLDRLSSPSRRLHDDILEYAQHTRATVEAMGVHIEHMIACVRRLVLSLWPASTMEPFGSYATGIWLPSSDVDLVILGVVEIHDRSLTVKSLQKLARALASQPWVESLVVLETAKIPVLKLVTAPSAVPIDITFESSATHSGLLARDLIKRYADDMPELYPLAVVFKQLLRERDLNDAYTGGLSSYSVVLMIIHFQLLWRYGDRCFRAAALFASGAPLPRPADLLAEEERLKQVQKQHDEAPKTKATTPTITSSFAAVVKSLKRPTSEGQSPSTKPATAPAQPFSYAAVAAGIAKLSTPEPKAPAAPVSYAAAVAAPPPPQAASKTRAGAPTLKKTKGDAMDAVSVTSSTADTEDCSDGTSSTTTSAHEEAAPDTASPSHQCQQPLHEPEPEPVEISLGERTMTILEFFGIVFDYRANGLSIRDGGYIYRLADHANNGSDLSKRLPSLVIEDPIHPDRNVSASSFAFAKVVSVFEDAFYALKYFRASRFTPTALSCLLSTAGHAPHHHVYQQQFHHLLASKKTKSLSSAKASKAEPVGASHKGVAIAAK
jgi:non-canonical poly(A) RNA polymerase PAPD5/7